MFRNLALLYLVLLRIKLLNRGRCVRAKLEPRGGAMTPPCHVTPANLLQSKEVWLMEKPGKKARTRIISNIQQWRMDTRKQAASKDLGEQIV